MFQTKVVEKIKTHILFLITCFRKSYRLWDNVKKHRRAGQATDDSMAHAHCMLDYKVTNTPSEYVILIAFPRQQWLHERASLLPYTYTACLVTSSLRSTVFTQWIRILQLEHSSSIYNCAALTQKLLPSLVYFRSFSNTFPSPICVAVFLQVV